jgi:hypothetical protein
VLAERKAEALLQDLFNVAKQVKEPPDPFIFVVRQVVIGLVH